MPIIKAVFQGKNGSLGYKNNRIYDLYISRNVEGRLLVHSADHTEQACFYDSEKSFLKNWMTSRQVLIEKIGHPTIKLSDKISV